MRTIEQVKADLIKRIANVEKNIIENDRKLKYVIADDRGVERNTTREEVIERLEHLRSKRESLLEQLDAYQHQVYPEYTVEVNNTSNKYKIVPDHLADPRAGLLSELSPIALAIKESLSSGAEVAFNNLMIRVRSES